MVRCRVLSLADAGVRRSRGQGRSCGDGCTVAEGGAQSLTTTLKPYSGVGGLVSQRGTAHITYAEGESPPGVS